jgi:hypothetical protein
MKRFKKWMAIAGGALGSVMWSAPRASACGCFAPPDPSVPIVQAGERIVFATSNGQVVAHIQIQYQGNASDFGWLLPLPAVPTKADGTPGLELGVDELFNQIINNTQPKYELKRVYPNQCGVNFGFAGGAGGGGEATPSAQNDSGGMGKSDVLVIQSSIGPYDFAVLKGDDNSAMMQWLNTNHYFVPAGTNDVVAPYIHPGAYFLALKLKSGQSAGNLQPVVVRYASDLPMIPIILTSVAAQDNMGIQVWMVGNGRAIPRNYYHTVINDAAIDWANAGQNYNDVIIKAVNETPALPNGGPHHMFVTEYAGSSSVMRNVLDAPGRFGVFADLAQITDPVLFVEYLQTHGFGTANNNFGGGGAPGPGFASVTFPSEVIGILQNYIPMPQALIASGTTAAQYYGDLQYYLGQYKQMNPAQFAGLNFNYDPQKMTQDLWDRVVTPTLAAGKLFTDYSYLTRLYTTLSPADMNRDPVFSYNPDLPDFSNVHQATLTYHCGFNGNIDDATLVTEEGFTMDYPGGNAPSTLPTVPATLRTEILRESGAPEVVTDNTGSIKGSLGDNSGCSVTPGRAPRGGLAGLALLLGFGLMIARRARRSTEG